MDRINRKLIDGLKHSVPGMQHPLSTARGALELAQLLEDLVGRVEELERTVFNAALKVQITPKE